MAKISDPEPDKAAVSDLVRGAREGDREAFTALYRMFAAVVHGIMIARGPRAEAEDLTQDVFVKAFERLSDLHDPEVFASWLCKIARNAATDAWRRDRGAAATARGEELSVVADRGRSPAVAVEQAEVAQQVLDHIGSLSATYRETLVLRLVEGLSGPEIAARTGMTQGSVRVNLTRGMALLRPLLQEAGLE